MIPFSELTWREVALAAVLAGALLCTKRFAPDAYGDVLTVVLGILAYFRQPKKKEEVPPTPQPVVTANAAIEKEKPDLKIITGGLAILLALGFAPAAIGCAATTEQNVSRATIAADYQKQLVECFLKGQGAKSLPVYKACADSVDVRFGLGLNVDAGVK